MKGEPGAAELKLLGNPAQLHQPDGMGTPLKVNPGTPSDMMVDEADTQPAAAAAWQGMVWQRAAGCCLRASMLAAKMVQVCSAWCGIWLVFEQREGMSMRPPRQVQTSTHVQSQQLPACWGYMHGIICPARQRPKNMQILEPPAPEGDD